MCMKAQTLRWLKNTDRLKLTVPKEVYYYRDGLGWSFMKIMVREISSTLTRGNKPILPQSLPAHYIISPPPYSLFSINPMLHTSFLWTDTLERGRPTLLPPLPVCISVLISRIYRAHVYRSQPVTHAPWVDLGQIQFVRYYVLIPELRSVLLPTLCEALAVKHIDPGAWFFGPSSSSSQNCDCLSRYLCWWSCFPLLCKIIHTTPSAESVGADLLKLQC